MGFLNRSICYIGSKSPHLNKFLSFFSNYFDKVVLITNKKPDMAFSNCIVYEVDFSLKKLWNILTTTNKIKNILEKEKPNLLHIHQANSYAFYTLLANRSLKIPSILNIWGSDILVLPKVNVFLREMVKYNLKNADVIVVESFFEENIVRSLIGNKEKEIRLMNFGIYDDYLEEDVNEIINYKENIVFSNRLHNKLYRIDKIIEAYAKLVKYGKYNDWRLVIAGSGEETENLKKLVLLNNLEDKVEFIGWVSKDELKDWYKRSKIFISIPLSDGVPLSVLEAMSYGCLLVVSYIPSVIEFVIDKINAIVVNNVESLDKFLEEAINLCNSAELIKSNIELNRRIIREHAIYSKNMEKFSLLYYEMIKRV
ncbi:glycosyltransferase family 4 protein [Dictyoglomus thermophilum]|uniref:glycosyltransferase family 4 protein n=1 Tax=Dictyoglomus thermophilum TaxID=14 RepID=UPI0011EABD84|nr:glycosyltransferase family 4 protein [Dictyoglomus thermophilum]TYT23356.1 glycosyltransferase family 4 protein [Dictyoglomus thermophilum]